jgi:translation initiation factor 2-alpha kinase 4
VAVKPLSKADMAPKPHGNKKAPATPNVQKHAQPVDQAGAPPINYAEVQAEEVEVLQAIFMEDYEQVETKSAWSKTTDLRFKLKLRAYSDAESFVILSAQLTATYPKSAPLLEVSDLHSFHERTQKRIQNVILKKPRQMLGEVMIHAIASDIQEALEDAVLAKQSGTLPSLEEERASAEEVATALAKEAEEAETRRNLEAQEEEDRVLKQMVDEEVTRRQKRRPTRTGNGDGGDLLALNANDEVVTFDQPAKLSIGSEHLEFSKVSIVSHGRGFLLAKPTLVPGILPPLVTIKRYATQEKSRVDLLNIEKVLDGVCALRHQNILSVYAYRIDKIDLLSEFTLCTEYASRGTLEDLLMLCGPLQLDKARHFTIQLLEALDECHRKGIAHSSLSVKTVCITGGSAPVPKLANVGYTSVIQSERYELPPKWDAPEGSSPVSDHVARKTDIWMLGVLVLQMFLGLDILTEGSPQNLLEKLSVTDSFEEFVRKMLNGDSKKRPTAFDLLPVEFLRTDAAAIETESPIDRRGDRSSHSGLKSPFKRRSRHGSSNFMDTVSRYTNDFTEVGRLGKGGFGEVVKARNKLDGGVYAVKKISQAPQLDKILSEVMLLNRLNHPYVVRYYSTWVEETLQALSEDAVSTTEDTVTEDATEFSEDSEDSEQSDDQRFDFGYQSTSGLDFVSSSGYPNIEFGGDSSSEASAATSEPGDIEIQFNGSSKLGSIDESTADSALRLRKSRSESRKAQSTLYIQMEYCERHTLRDLIRKATLTEDDSWRFVRQITEGLAHVHSHGIIHRDLKPDNIFIDVAGNPKIGDFGLATTSQYQVTDKLTTNSGASGGGDMTRSVGTTLYVAPELRSASGTNYNDKVDMYSLGIMFFEMCEPFGTAMERIRSLQDIREKEHELPAAYLPNGAKAAEGKLIECLISHKPGERPSSTELLRSNILPVKIEDETIRQALSGLSDSRSPYHQKMMSALFSHEQASNNKIKALAWDAKDQAAKEDTARLRMRTIAKGVLESVFRRHGAEEVRRETVFPRSGYYNHPNVVQLLDASGNLVQLPYDLTFPFARQLARRECSLRHVYTFDRVFRDTFSGGPPKANEEVDFDIVSLAGSEDQALDDAEIVKVLDEMTEELPDLTTSGTICFHLNHANILDAILESCRVPTAQQAAVKECISKLGYHTYTWAKIRAELRSAAIGLSITMVNDLQQFDFRDTPEKAFAKIHALLDGAGSRIVAKLDSGIKHVRDVLQNLNHLGLYQRLYVTPLGSFNAKFYDNGILVQCVHERKSTRDVIAAGGRYDSLIRAQRAPSATHTPQGAVGVSIGIDRLVANIIKSAKGSSKALSVKDNSSHLQSLDKRCNVLLVAGGTEGVRIAGLKILSSLWANHISAELAVDERTWDNEDHYRFVVTLRHEASTTVRVRGTSEDATECDVPTTALVSHVHQELREREGTRARQPVLTRQPSSHQDAEHKGSVQVLMAQHRSKKSNKFHIVSAAREQWERCRDQWKDAPILAIETRDDVLELLRETRLSDAESWRKMVQSVQLNERQYLQQVQDILAGWRKSCAEGDGSREACLFNFRTGHCVYYDVSL